MQFPDYPCPGCGRPLQADGVAECDGEAFAVYACDACTRDWHFDGATIPIALTFAVRGGVIVDPQTFAPFPPVAN